jgi:hypothetical protein
LLYVGITKVPAQRFGAHRVQSLWWSEVAKIETDTVADLETAARQEVEQIGSLKPRYNVVHNRLYAERLPRMGVSSVILNGHRIKELRASYELAQEWLGKAENGRPTVNQANHRIRVLMRFFSRVHNTL